MERKTCSVCFRDSGFAPFHDSCRIDELKEIVVLVGKHILLSKGEALILPIPLRARILREMGGEELSQMGNDAEEILRNLAKQQRDFPTDGLEKIGVALGIGMEQPGGLCDGE